MWWAWVVAGVGVVALAGGAWWAQARVRTRRRTPPRLTLLQGGLADGPLVWRRRRARPAETRSRSGRRVAR